MNKSFLYAGAGIAAVLLIGVAAVSMDKEGKPVEGPRAEASQISLKEIFAKGDSQKCVFSSREGGIESSGTVYVTSGRMRGDFAMKIGGGQSVESHMITDGQTAHMWSDILPQGMKMSFAAMDDNDQANNTVDANQKIDYKCDAWTPEQDKFILPPIQFVDLAAVASKAEPGSAECSQCDMISDQSAKAQCRAALSCN